MSCLTEVTGTTVITLNTQHTIIDVPEEFGHAVDKAQSESKKTDIFTIRTYTRLHGRNQSSTK